MAAKTRTPSLFGPQGGTSSPYPLSPDPSRPRAVSAAVPAQADAEDLLRSEGHRPSAKGGPLGFGQDSRVLDTLDDPEAREDYTQSLQTQVGRKVGKVYNPSLRTRTASKLDTAQFLNDLSKLRHGDTPNLALYDPQKRRELLVAHFIVDATDAATHQLTKGDQSGLEWYDADLDQMERGLVHVIDHHPDFKSVAGTFGRPGSNGQITTNPAQPLQNPRMVLFKALLACTSPMRDPVLNTKTAFDILRHAVKSNPQSPFSALPPKNPEPSDYVVKSAQERGKPVGHGWPGLSDPGPALRLINRLVSDKGETGAAEWLLDPHNRSELEQYKPDLVPGDLTNGAGVPHPGAYVFGPKAGPFFLNNNRDGAHVTKDIWFSRFWNRVMGSLVEPTKGTPKNPSTLKIVDEPRGPEERSIMTEATKRAATALDLKPHELQAVLWYYEQQLWSALGAKSPSYSYVDGVRAVAQTAGLTGLPTAPRRRTADARRRAAAPAEAAARRYRRRGKARRYGRPTGPDPAVLANAQSYLKSRSTPFEPIADYAAIDPQRSKAIADAYDALQHDPHHPAIRASYEALKHETALQYQHLKDAGVRLEPWRGSGQPYANSQEMCADARHGHLWYFTGGDMPSDHPLAAKAPIDAPDGSPQTFNDLFRAVHDYYGHALYGNEFGPRGEEHAWRSHVRMYSPAARPAMTMETRGQNSWVNFGHHLRDPETGEVRKPGDPGYLSPTERPYAEQKAAVLPEEHSVPYARRVGSPRRYMLDSFGSKLRENPWDHDTHGVLADYLEDQGHPEADWHRWFYNAKVTPIPHPDGRGWVRLHAPTATSGGTQSAIPKEVWPYMDDLGGAHTLSYESPRGAYKDLRNGWLRMMRAKHGRQITDHAVQLARRGPKRRYDHRAFEAHLAEHPLDYDAHGVYADYLEDEGDKDAAWHRWLYEHKPVVKSREGGSVHTWYVKPSELPVLWASNLSTYSSGGSTYVHAPGPHSLLSGMKAGHDSWRAEEAKRADEASRHSKFIEDQRGDGWGGDPERYRRRQIGQSIRRHARSYLATKRIK